jgi:hypothetical protein
VLSLLSSSYEIHRTNKNQVELNQQTLDNQSAFRQPWILEVSIKLATILNENKAIMILQISTNCNKRGLLCCRWG